MHIKVNKSKKRLQLINNGAVVFDFPCAIGKVKGKKEKEADLKTPEGEYKIVVKNPKSKYFLSLGLNYPNIQDAQNGFEKGLISKQERDQIIKAQKENLIIPWNTQLGGEIYIHGNLNNSKNYTLGCIKISDENMKKLYGIAYVGLKVVIK